MNQSATSTGNTDGSLISSDRVEGTKLLDRSGKDIGKIKSLKIDKVSGRVAYAVAEFGGLFGVGGHEYTIPWNTLEYNADKHGYSTGLTKEQLEKSPERSRRSSGEYRASGGGVGTGHRPDADAAADRGDRPDSDLDDDDATWNRDRDREIYDYYAVEYYWDR